MGRRRRRVVRIVKKKLPTVFVCPRCGEEAVRVSIDKTTGKATVLCALCNLKNEFQAHPLAHAIDVYSYFTDVFYGVPNPRAIIPRDREIPQSAPEPIEEEAEKTEPPQSKTSENFETEPTIEERPEKEAILEQESTTPEQTITADTGETPQGQTEMERDEEAEPFADILSNTDKKRYSTRPLTNQREQAQQQESEEETSTSEQSATSP